MQDEIELGPIATIAAAFALGAAATWLVYTALERRQAPGHIDDKTLLKRVRGRIASIASSPESIEVDVNDGVVRLSGDVPPDERDLLLTSIREMPGVFRLRNAMGVAG